jgi:hypothetical protein
VAKKKPTRKSSPTRRKDTVRALGLETLAEAIRTLLSIEGVEGIGQPVTLISPGDLPLDFLGFVDRLRGGSIELDEEILVITLVRQGRGRKRKNPVFEQLRQTLDILTRYATDKSVSTNDVLALLEEAKQKLRRRAK